MSDAHHPSTEWAGDDAGAGLRFLSVYSGIGAHDAGLRAAGVNVVGQIELDPFCQAVLAKNFGPLPRWRDVRDASVDAVRNACGRLDGITGGFMCTDISVAGRAAGLGRETRSGLTWRHLFRLIRGLRPRFILIENVPALRERGYDRVAAPLERIGYALWPVVVGAWAIGAPHRRNRVWVVGRLQPQELAHPNGRRSESGKRRAGGAGANRGGDASATRPTAQELCGGGVADPIGGHGERGLSQPVGESQGGIAIGGTGASCESEFRSSGQRRDCRSTSGCGNSTGSNGRTGSDRHGSSKLAYSASGGLRTDGSPLGDAGHADERHEALDDAELARWGAGRGVAGDETGAGRGRGEPAGTGQDRLADANNSRSGEDTELRKLRSGRTEQPSRDSRSTGKAAATKIAFRRTAWPARPGEPQHAWEAPRLLEFGLGCTASRSADGLVQPADRDAARLESWANKQALKALGNCNPPHIPYLIGRWLIQQGEVA